MQLDKINHRRLWCETESGEIADVDLVDGSMPPVETHPFAVARFPREVRTVYYRRRAEDGMYGGTDEMFVGTSSFSESLALALATGKNEQRTFTLSEAMVIAAEACERCMNALAHQYGLPDGYPEGSEPWLRSRTECVMCREEYPQLPAHAHGEPPSTNAVDPSAQLPGTLTPRA